MNKSNSIQFILLFVALSVLICGISSCDATNTFLDENNLEVADFTDEYSTNSILPDKYYENNDIDEEIVNEERKHLSYDNFIESTDSKTIKNDKNMKALPGKIPVNISTDDVTCNIGEDAHINVLMNPDNIAEGVLTLYIDDELIRSHNLSYLEPSYTINTSNYVVGVHDVKVEYSGSLVYESAHVYSNLIINKHESSPCNLTSDFTEDNHLNISFGIISDDKYLETGLVDIFYLDEHIASVNLNSSLNYFITSNEYNFEVLTFKFYGDKIHEGFVSDQLIYAKKLKTNVYLPSLNGYYGSVIDSNIMFYANHIVNDGVVDLYVNSTLIGEYDVNDSVMAFSIDLNNYPEGSYDVFVSYCDSNVYEDASFITTLRVNKIRTNIYLANISGYRGSLVDINVSVSNYVDITDDGIVELFIDDESIHTMIVKDGSISTKYLIPDNLDYGSHRLSAYYYGSNRYDTSDKTSTLTVNKYKTSLYLRNTTLDDNGSIVVNLRLYSYDNDVNEGVVKCFINDTLIASSSVCDNECMIILPDEFISNTPYDLTFEYGESEYFNNSRLNTTIQQNKTNTTLSISKYLSNNNTLSITSYVYSKDYSVINDGIIKFYVNDMLIGISEVENNKANIEYDMTEYPEGIYTISVKYENSKKYEDNTNTTTVDKKIIQKTIYINSPTIIKTTPNEIIEINANLTDYESNLITKEIPATIHIANITINTTFKDGYLKYAYQLPEDMDTKQTITIKTENMTYYKAANKNITLNIQRNNTYITSKNTYTSNKLDELELNFTLNSNNEILNTRTPAAIKVNNITVYQGFFNNGVLNYTLKLNNSYTQNQYTITVIAGQTTHYNKSTKDVSLKLNNRKTYIESQNIYSKKGDKILFKATLYDQITKKAITTPVNMSIKINNLTIITKESNQGQIIYTYPNNFNKENYEITIKSAQTGIYLSSQWNGTLTNTREYIKVSTQNINAKANTTINIKAKILKDNKLITSMIPVAVKINNLTICNLNISNGTINYQYKLPDTLSQKEYNITIITGDTREYIQSETASKLIITKNYQEIITENITTKANKTVTIKARIIDINKNNIKSDARVNIKIAGKSIADIDTRNGIINYEYNPGNIKQGLYDLLIQTGETNCYYHATTHTTLKVE